MVRIPAIVSLRRSKQGGRRARSRSGSQDAYEGWEGEGDRGIGANVGSARVVGRRAQAAVALVGSESDGRNPKSTR